MAASTPTPKMAAAGVSGALALVIVWVAGMFGVEVPPEVAAAATVIISFAAGYLKRDTSSPSRHAAE